MSYNTDLQSNNEELADILRTVNELPEASGESAEKPWSEVRTLVLEEDVSIFTIDLGGTYTEADVLIIPHKAESATASGNYYFYAETDVYNANASLSCTGNGLAIGTGAIWNCYRFLIEKHGSGLRMFRNYQTSYLPSFMQDHGNGGGGNFTEHRGAIQEFTQLRFQTWVNGAAFGKGTTVYYAVR